MTPVNGGWDTGASVHRATLASGVPVAAKLSRSTRTGGLRVAAELSRAGLAGIPAPVLARSGQPFSIVEGVRLSVSRWLSGRVAMDSGLSELEWRAFGALLAGVHAAVPGGAVRAALATEDFHTPEVETLRSLDARLRGGQRTPAEPIPAESGPDSDPLATELTRTWRTGAERIALLGRQTDALGTELRGRGASVGLCHADAHLGNVVVDDAGRVWLLDWDEAILAPRERDLMFVIGGVLSGAPVTIEQEGWFFGGYGDAAIDPVRLAYYRCSWAVQDLVNFATLILDRSARPGDLRVQALALFLGLLAPTGIVATAVRSLREIGR